MHESLNEHWVIRLLVIIAIVRTTHRQLYAYAHKEISFDEEFTSRQSFVDKSEFLVEFFDDVGRDFFIAPALFGKTSNLKMIEKFTQYQWNVLGNPIPWNETHAYQVFKGLNISKHGDIMREHMAQHPVILFDLNMENAGIGVFEHLLSRMNSQLSHCFLEHQHKFETYYSSANMKSHLRRWVMKMLTTSMSRKELVTNLQYTIEAMNECFDADVVLLIDGFDDFMYRKCEPIEKMFDMFRVFHTMLRNVFESSASGNVHVFISSTSSLVFYHFQMYKYMQMHRFLENGKYTKYFGIDRHELNAVFDRYESNYTERQHVLKYLDGYTIEGRSYYSPYSISEFYQKRYFSKPRIPYRSFVRPKNPCKFIWKFLKNPKYLNAVAKTLKRYPTIEGEFRKRYDPGAFTLYIDYVSQDFNNTGTTALGANLMFTLSIEHGVFQPVTENTYDVANYLMYTLLIRHLRLHFKLFCRIDIVAIGSYLNRILHSMHEAQAKTDLQTSLTEAITKLKIPQQQGYALEFIYHSLLHAATYTNESLQMIEDYPTPVPYRFTDKYAASAAHRHCVSLIRNRDTDTALLIKITRRKSAKIALEQASSYVYHAKDVRVVKYVGIDVDFRGVVNILIDYVDDQLKVAPKTIKKYAQRAVGRL